MTTPEAVGMVASVLAAHAPRWYAVESHAPVVERHHRDTAEAVLSALFEAGWKPREA